MFSNGPEQRAGDFPMVSHSSSQRGAFGAPTFFVGDEMFFGHDRLDFVEAALARGT